MKQIAKKFLTLIITLFIVSLLAFLAFQVIPASPATKILGMEATPEEIAALEAELGLDRPVLVRYGEWLVNFLQGDFGESYSYHMPVAEMIAPKLAITALLTLISFLFTLVLSIPLGVLAGSVRSRGLDSFFAALNQVVMSVPPFFIGILSCFVFGIMLKWFTPGDFVSFTEDWGRCLSYLLLPAVSIAIPRIAMTVKLMRSAVQHELRQDYVRTAQSRGNSRWSVMLRHVLKNALIPVIAFLAVSAAEIMTNTIIMEQVFTIPGIGRLLLASINNRDFVVVQAIVVMVATWIVLVNFVADLLYQLVDPRIRLK